MEQNEKGNHSQEAPNDGPESSPPRKEIAVTGEAQETKGNKALRIIERRKLASKVRHLLARAKSPAEVCRTLSITRSQYRYCVAWMTRETFQSNLEAFSWFHISGQADLDRLELLLIRAESDGDLRSAAALSKVKADTRSQMVEVALKLGILDREAMRIKLETVDVRFGDENQSPWFVKTKEEPLIAEQVM